jgi:hypothetical protein
MLENILQIAGEKSKKRNYRCIENGDIRKVKQNKDTVRCIQGSDQEDHILQQLPTVVAPSFYPSSVRLVESMVLSNHNRWKKSVSF